MAFVQKEFLRRCLLYFFSIGKHAAYDKKCGHMESCNYSFHSICKNMRECGNMTENDENDQYSFCNVNIFYSVCLSFFRIKNLKVLDNSYS